VVKPGNFRVSFGNEDGTYSEKEGIILMDDKSNTQPKSELAAAPFKTT